jgi:glycosyltransferase involved in cell wall biosynthesis
MAALRALAQSLDVECDLDLVGYQDNPFKYMARASVFVLSSRFEGLGNVLIEALACGCPVVSTDCDSGPAEVLGHGDYGRLVPVGDTDALAQAILHTLDERVDRDRLRKRAGDFAAQVIACEYERLFGRYAADHC